LTRCKTDEQFTALANALRAWFKDSPSPDQSSTKSNDDSLLTRGTPDDVSLRWKFWVDGAVARILKRGSVREASNEPSKSNHTAVVDGNVSSLAEIVSREEMWKTLLIRMSESGHVDTLLRMWGSGISCYLSVRSQLDIADSIKRHLADQGTLRALKFCLISNSSQVRNTAIQELRNEQTMRKIYDSFDAELCAIVLVHGDLALLYARHTALFSKIVTFAMSPIQSQKLHHALTWPVLWILSVLTLRGLVVPAGNLVLKLRETHGMLVSRASAVRVLKTHFEIEEARMSAERGIDAGDLKHKEKLCKEALEFLRSVA